MDSGSYEDVKVVNQTTKKPTIIELNKEPHTSDQMSKSKDDISKDISPNTLKDKVKWKTVNEGMELVKGNNNFTVYYALVICIASQFTNMIML